MATLYVFLDESGNLDFSRNGTGHYVLAAVTSTNPLVSSQGLQQLKYSQLERGVDTELFHASEDRQATRDLVVAQLQTMSNTIKVHYIYAKKSKAYPALQNPAAFYAKLGTTLIKFVVAFKSNGYDKVVVIFDKVLNNKDKRAFLGVIKPELKKMGRPYQIYFHRTLSDFNGQIADYFAWSKYVALERNETRPLVALGNIDMTDFDLFAAGTKEWY
jgi:hypothetical protein